jgi:hypothetical protein
LTFCETGEPKIVLELAKIPTPCSRRENIPTIPHIA